MLFRCIQPALVSLGSFIFLAGADAKSMAIQLKLGSTTPFSTTQGFNRGISATDPTCKCHACLRSAKMDIAKIQVKHLFVRQFILIPRSTVFSCRILQTAKSGPNPNQAETSHFNLKGILRNPTVEPDTVVLLTYLVDLSSLY